MRIGNLRENPTLSMLVNHYNNLYARCQRVDFHLLYDFRNDVNVIQKSNYNMYAMERV